MFTPSEVKRLNKQTKKTTPDEDMAIINPNYSPDNYGYSNNCAYCTAAYDLRRRGYDVEAKPRITEEEVEKIKNDIENDPKFKDATDDELLSEFLTRCPEYPSVSNLQSWYNDPELVWHTDILHSDTDLEKRYKEYAERPYDDKLRNSFHSALARAMTKEIKAQGDGARGFFMTEWVVGSGHAMAYEVENGSVVIRDCQTNEKKDILDIIGMSKSLYFFRTDNLTPTPRILSVVRNRKEK